MKILMIISEAPPVTSGVARVAEKLQRGLKLRGHQVDTLSLHDIPRFEMGEIRLSSMPFKMAGLRQQFNEYDVIHLHGPVPTFSDVFLLWGLRGLRRKRPQLVYTHHAPIELNHIALRPLLKIYNLLQERLARLADHVVVSTPSYMQRLSRYVPASKLSVVPWGVDFNQFYTPVHKDGPFTVLYVGQIRPYKGLPVLLNAAQDLESTRLWVVGDGHFAAACQEQAGTMKLPDVTFWGRISDEELYRLARQAHVVVLPSVTRSEAFGIVLLEGMAAGMVPVASHLPGVADIVGNEGFTFPPGSDRSLHEILKRLRDDQQLRVHMAGLAQAKARLYSWERSIYGYERIFTSLTKKPSYLHQLRAAEDPVSTASV